MDPLSLIGGLGTALIGAGAGAAGRGQSLELIQQSIRELENIGIPSVEAQQIVLQDYKSAGMLTPELEQAFLQGDTSFKDIDVDPVYKSAQLAALDELRQVGESGGMRLSDRADLESTLGDINTQERGAREAIAGSLKERGQYGSGLELAMALDNQQQASGQAHETGLKAYGDAQDRALEAIIQGGTMAGGLREQDFGEQARVAAAQDAINQFNAMQRTGTGERNINRTNQANEFNLKNDQRILDANVDNKNNEEVTNKGLYQQEYNNQLAKAQAAANARSGAASNITAGANATQQMLGTIGQGIGQLGQAYNSGDTSKTQTQQPQLLIGDWDEEQQKKYGGLA